MRKTILLAVAVLGFVPANGFAHNHSSPAERYFAARCDQSHSLACVHRAALHWEVSYSYMKGIGYRESRWNPYAKNPSSTASGLFQFLYPSTWRNTPYGGYSVWSAKYNALAAAWAMHRGYYSWWAATS